jgi:hypothetical protein
MKKLSSFGVDVLQYGSASRFLKDWSLAAKKNHADVSFRLMGNALHEFPSYVFGMLNGKNKIPLRLIGPFSSIIGLKGRRLTYFKVLCFLSQVTGRRAGPIKIEILRKFRDD